jgi:hypothetical protein
MHGQNISFTIVLKGLSYNLALTDFEFAGGKYFKIPDYRHTDINGVGTTRKKLDEMKLTLPEVGANNW